MKLNNAPFNVVTRSHVLLFSQVIISGLFYVRDAVFRVLAVEQPESTVLNYAPGPLDTPMIDDLLADQRTDPG